MPVSDKSFPRPRPGALITLLLLLFHSLGAQEGQAPDPGDIGEPEIPREADVFLGPLRVRAETSPPVPFAGEPWTVTILAEYPNPAEVTVRPPRFPPPVVLERVRTGSRLIRENPGSPEESASRWTTVEFLFTLQSPGPLALDPFEILAPGRAGSSGEITLQVRSRRNPGQYNPSFHWENVPPFLRLGEQGELTLALSNWDPRLPPPENFFQGRPPLNCLLEPLGGQDRGIYRLRIIPLEGDRAALEPWTFVHEGYTLRVPGLSIPFKKAEVLEVSPDPGEGIFPAVSLSPDSGEKPVPKAGALFPGAALIPAGRAAVFFPFRGFYDRAVERARNLWLENKAPEALAELRRAEASALTGSTLIPLRRELEENLGLGPTPDERWDPLGGLTGVLPGLLLGVLCLLGGARRVPARIQGFRRSRKTAQGIAAVSCPSIRTRMEGEIQAESPVPTTAHAVVGHAPIELLSFESLESIQATGGSGNLSPGEHPVTGGGRFIPPARKKGVTSFWGNGYKTIASLVLVLVGLGLIIFSLGKAPGNFRGRGVMKGAAVFRIPDSGGAAAAWFEEGQPVFIRSPAGNWIYAESPDGRGGWVPRDAVADY